jgi:hypothetical protein
VLDRANVQTDLLNYNIQSDLESINIELDSVNLSLTDIQSRHSAFVNYYSKYEMLKDKLSKSNDKFIKIYNERERNQNKVSDYSVILKEIDNYTDMKIKLNQESVHCNEKINYHNNLD